MHYLNPFLLAALGKAGQLESRWPNICLGRTANGLCQAATTTAGGLEEKGSARLGKGGRTEGPPGRETPLLPILPGSQSIIATLSGGVIQGRVVARPARLQNAFVRRGTSRPVRFNGQRKWRYNQSLTPTHS